MTNTNYSLTTYGLEPNCRFALTFADLAKIVRLPPSATKALSLWRTVRNAHAHAATWLDAGFQRHARLRNGSVRFQRGGDPRSGIGGPSDRED